MASELVVSEILPEGSRELGRLAGGEASVGRDQADGIVIDNSAVSRSHGMFFKIRNHWFYKDLGSTNGSWRNGKLVKEGHICLVRPGDVLQLADTPLRIDAETDLSLPGGGFEGFGQFPSSTLIVFSGQEFNDEFPLPEYGRALVIGGAQGDLPLSESIEELPRLVVERRGDNVCTFGVADGPPIYLNGEEISETVTLSDGDELRLAHYVILFNDPVSSKTGSTEIPKPQEYQPPPVQETTGPGAGAGQGRGFGPGSNRPSATYKSWDEQASKSPKSAGQRTPSGRFTFGQTDYEDEDVEGTVAINPADVEARLAGYNLHPSSRYQTPLRSSGGSIHSLEDKLIVLIGFLLLICLIGLVVWWVFLT